MPLVSFCRRALPEKPRPGHAHDEVVDATSLVGDMARTCARRIVFPSDICAAQNLPAIAARGVLFRTGDNTRALTAACNRSRSGLPNCRRSCAALY